MIKELVTAGLPEDAQGLVMLEGDLVAQTKLARAIDDQAQLKTLVDPADKKDIGNAVKDALSPLTETFNHYDNGLELSTSARSAVEVLAQQLVVQNGLSPKGAAKAAAADFTAQYQFSDGFRIPRGIAEGTVLVRSFSGTRGVNPTTQIREREVPRGDVIASGARAAMAVLSNPQNKFAQIMVSAFLGLDPRLSLDKRNQFTLDGVRADGQWITSEDERGLSLIVTPDGVPVPVRDHNGNPITLNWSDLERLGIAAANTPDGVSLEKNITPLLEEILP